MKGSTATTNGDARPGPAGAGGRGRAADGAHAPGRPAPLGMERIGALPATSGIARVIAHNRAVRRRLIAAIGADARRAGLGEAACRALAVRLTGETSCAEMTLEQLRRVAGALAARAAAGRRSSPAAGAETTEGG